MPRHVSMAAQEVTLDTRTEVVSRSKRIRAAQTPAGVALALTVLLLWIALISQLNMGVTLDASWQHCNAWFLRHRAQAGITYIFPTGLLACFYTNTYDGALFWPSWLWQILVKTCLTANIWTLTRRFPQPGLKVLILLACAFCLPMSSDAIYYAFLLSISSLLLYPNGLSPAYIAFNVGLLALISFLKFSLLLMALLLILFAACRHWQQGRSWKSSPALLYGVVFLVIWLLLGQRLSNLPGYFHNELAVSLGYNSAMGSLGQRRAILPGTLLLVGVMALLLSVKQPEETKRLPGVLLLVLFTLQLWKLAFVRNDNAHAAIFFNSILFMVLMLPVYFTRYQPQPGWYRAATALCVLLGMVGTIVTNPYGNPRHLLGSLRDDMVAKVSFVVAPNAQQRHLEAQRAQLQTLWSLPAIKARVQDTPIDMLSSEQFVLLLNGLNYHQRPVYQGYSAYSPYLTQLNADFFRRPQAPPYVLYKLEPIDERYPTLDDNLTLLELLKSYHPVLTEKGYTLLTRNPRPAALPTPAATARTERTVSFGEEVAIGTDVPYHLLRIHIHESLLGKLRAVLVRPAEIGIKVRLENGETARYRLIPAMTQTDFLLDPLVTTSQDVIGLYGHLPGKRVKSFHVEAPSEKWFEPEMQITLTGLPELIGAPISAQQAARLLAPDGWRVPGHSGL